MVNVKQVREANEELKPLRAGLTAVVVGGTNGIGRGFVTALAAQTEKPKIYVVGRTSTSLDGLVAELKGLNAAGTYIPIVSGDLTLLANVDKASAQIVEREQAEPSEGGARVDLLYMSQGFLTLAGRNESPEGLDRVTSIRHYGRALLALNLLPLLRASADLGLHHPRVISVLAAGREGPVIPEDLGLRAPGNYSFVNANNAAGTYLTLSMEALRREEPRVAFVHAFPGLVRSNLFSTEHWGAVAKFFINWILLPTVGRLFFISTDEAGERFLYLASTPKITAAADSDDAKSGALLGSDGVKGGGAYAIDEKQEAVVNDKILKPLRENGMDIKIWEHTKEEIERVLGRKV
ncbi:hypothetical protein BX600DRAFT_437087 [Xylariales sp. PMI_506]|nr:hypothetical protein BX600DRAFT_437087 [Xylariales sp. PMI_506]